MAHDYRTDRTASITKFAVNAANAPEPVGPYSQAICAGDLVFVSGQDPIDPNTGAEPGEFKAQVGAALTNLDSILRAAGSRRENILKITVYLADFARFDDLNDAYADFFSDTVLPARTTVCVSRLHHALEVDCVAIVTSSRARRLGASRA